MNLKRVFSVMCIVLAVSSVIPLVASAAPTDDSKPANVSVYQERYIDDPVQVSKEGNRTIHITKGPIVEIDFKNADHANISKFGVEGQTGELRYNNAISRYVLDPKGTSGTYTLFWIVSERQVVQAGNSTKTQIVEQRYSTTIRADNVQMVHVDKTTYDKTQKAAANWSEWESSIRDVAPNANIERMTQTALNWVEFRADPDGYITKDFFSAIAVLGLTFGGLILLGMIASAVMGALISAVRYRHRRESLDPDDASYDEKRDDINLYMKNQSLEGEDLSEVYTNPEVAAQVRDSFGAESVADALYGLMSMYTDDMVLRDRINTFAAGGYDAAVRQSDDGVESARLIHPDDDSDLDDEEIVSMENPDDELVNALSEDGEIYEIPLHEIDAKPELEAELREYSLPELMEDLDASLDYDAESQEQMGKMVIELMEHVRQHPITDSGGRLKPMRVMVDHLLKLMWTASDKHDVPLVRLYAEQFARLLDETSVEDETRELIDRTQGGDFAPMNDD